MPRQARIDAPGALHHIIIRGIERKRIFQDDLDRDGFLSRIGPILAESKTGCYAWALDVSKERFERKHRLKSRGVTLSRISKRVSEVLEVDPEFIYLPGKYSQNVKAKSVWYRAVREPGISATFLARKLGLTQPAASISVKRGQAIADETGFQLLDK